MPLHSRLNGNRALDDRSGQLPTAHRNTWGIARRLPEFDLHGRFKELTEVAKTTIYGARCRPAGLHQANGRLQHERPFTPPPLKVVSWSRAAHVCLAPISGPRTAESGGFETGRFGNGKAETGHSSFLCVSWAESRDADVGSKGICSDSTHLHAYRRAEG